MSTEKERKIKIIAQAIVYLLTKQSLVFIKQCLANKFVDFWDEKDKKEDMEIHFDHAAANRLRKTIQGLTQKAEAATIRILNSTIRVVKEKEIQEMQRVFDRPKPFILRAFMTQDAKPGRLVARINIKNEEYGYGFQKRSYESILRPQVFGSERRLKSFEHRLRAIGVLPPDKWIVQASGCDEDAYGNIRPGQIVQILSYFRAFKEAGYTSDRPAGVSAKTYRNITLAKMERMARASKRKGLVVEGFSYFAIRRPRRGLAPGIYKRMTKGSIVPIMMFVREPRYRPLFHFYEVATRTAKETLPQEIRKYFKLG